MVRLVYCDNTGKKREKVLDNLADTKTMVVRGAAGKKYRTAEFLRASVFIS